MASKKFTIKDIKITNVNRDITRTHVDRLKEIIREKGYCKAFPIIVDEDGFIIDGQHRFLACKELGIEPPIFVEKSFDIVPILNSTQLKWGTKDYVKYYAEKDYPDYVILRRICISKKITPSAAFNIIFQKVVEKTGLSQAGGGKSPLKNGTLKLPDTSDKYLAKLERKIDLIMGLISNLGLPRTDKLIIAIARLAGDKNFNFGTMEKKLDFQRSRVYRCSTIQEYKQMLANIYNYKNTKKVTI